MNIDYTLIFLTIASIVSVVQGFRVSSVKRIAAQLQEELDGYKAAEQSGRDYKHRQAIHSLDLANLLDQLHNLQLLNPNYTDSPMYCDAVEVMGYLRLANFEYGGYSGTILFSTERKCWEGRIVSTNITYEALTLKGCKREFISKVNSLYNHS